MAGSVEISIYIDYAVVSMDIFYQLIIFILMLYKCMSDVHCPVLYV